MIFCIRISTFCYQISDNSRSLEIGSCPQNPLVTPRTPLSLLTNYSPSYYRCICKLSTHSTDQCRHRRTKCVAPTVARPNRGQPQQWPSKSGIRYRFGWHGDQQTRVGNVKKETMQRGHQSRPKARLPARTDRGRAMNLDKHRFIPKLQRKVRYCPVNRCLYFNGVRPVLD